MSGSESEESEDHGRSGNFYITYQITLFITGCPKTFKTRFTISWNLYKSKLIYENLFMCICIMGSQITLMSNHEL